MTTKAVNLDAQRQAIVDGLRAAFPGRELWAHEIYDSYVIAAQVRGDAHENEVEEAYAEPTAPRFWKIPYTLTLRPLPDEPNGLAVVEAVEFAPSDQWVQMLPTFVQFKTLAGADGQTRWLAVSSGGFEDGDKEVVSTGFLASALAYAEKSGDRGTLNFWHIPGTDIGTCDFQMLAYGFLMESGVFLDTPAGRAAAKELQEHPADYGLSIEFLWLNRTPEGVYTPPGTILRRSVLPKAKAAFPWSAIALKELETMTTAVSEEKRRALAALVGAEEAERMIAGLSAGAETLKQAGVRFKEVAEQAPAAEQVPGTRLEAVEQELVLNETAVKALADQVGATLLERWTAQEKAQQTALADLRTLVQGLAADVATLRQGEDERLAAKVRELPRATVKAIQRPTQRDATATPVTATDLATVANRTLYG